MKTQIKSIFILIGILCCPKIYSQTKVLFYTNKGNFTVELSDDLAPITTKNFKDLIAKKFYDGIIFHRVIDNFMIQGGDPTGTGNGGSGVVIKDEFHKDLSNLKATISMANAGPETGESQFFINLKDNTFLDHDKDPPTSKHPVFGKVINNFEVVQAIGKVPTNGEDRPVDEVIMDSLRIESPVGNKNIKTQLSKVELFPNPITAETSINFTIDKAEILKISLFDGLGRSIVSTKIKAFTGRNAFKLDNFVPVNTLNKGIYQLMITGLEFNIYQKVMVQ